MPLLLALLLLACTEPPPPSAPAAPPPSAPTAATPVLADPPAAAGASSPTLVEDGDGVLAAWVEPAAEGHRVLLSRWDGVAWAPPEVVAAGPRVASSWADRPALARAAGGGLVVAWLQGTEGTGTALMASLGGPEGWRLLGPVHSDGVQAEHGFAAAWPEGEGVRLWWLDGREVPAGGPTQVRSALVTQAVGPEEVVDPRACDCCGIDAAYGIVAWRDRGEAGAPDEAVRDITVSGPGGLVALADGWAPEGCPVNGPAVARRGPSAVVAWYTEAPRPTVKAAFSYDGGQRFGAPVGLDGGAPQGRVDVALVEGGAAAVVSWVEGQALHLRRVDAHGRAGADVVVGPAEAQAFPRLAATGEGVLVTWQEPGGALRGRVVPMQALPSKGTTTTLAAPVAPSRGPPFPADYVATDLDGGDVPFSAWAGKPALVNLWGTWCPPCMAELPALKTLHGAWGPRGVAFLGVAVGDDPLKVRAVKAQRGMDWTVLLDGHRMSSRTFGSDMLPTTLVYGADGALLYSHVGAVTAEDPELLAALAAAVE
ncbi:TlpA family protein disulfide reductase [Myxococcota bacterium]|nr:TlpA family protein disulfide reductase [Myxococcota bacterium]